MCCLCKFKADIRYWWWRALLHTVTQGPILHHWEYSLKCCRGRGTENIEDLYLLFYVLFWKWHVLTFVESLWPELTTWTYLIQRARHSASSKSLWLQILASFDKSWGGVYRISSSGKSLYRLAECQPEIQHPMENQTKILVGRGID